MKLGNKGFFNPKIIKTIAFALISLCIIGSIVLCIMAIWDYADRDTLWRMIATLGVIGLGSAVFAFINGVFGD
ncbi:hypothetical protein ES708_33606 [subsurface metagenome]